jgi:hypothetical protein
MRPYLVFVRAGPKSLHLQHLREDRERNWDCCVSWYSNPGENGGAERSTTGGINKFDALAIELSNWSGISAYRYVLVRDDDVYFRPGDISRYFVICERYGLFLSQPALSWRSHFSIRITLHNPFTRLRRVTFVEVMTPCLSAAALQILRPTFQVTKSTWGIDLAWTAACGAEHEIHIVDEITVTHTKPIDRQSGAFYKRLRDMGVDPRQELRQIYERFEGRDLRVLNHSSGHLYRAGIPNGLGAPAIQIGEGIKVAAKLFQSMRKKCARWWPRLQRAPQNPCEERRP